MDAQHAGWAVSFQVGMGSGPLAEQEGQDVIVILALIGRHVDLDELEEADKLSARALTLRGMQAWACS